MDMKWTMIYVVYSKAEEQIRQKKNYTIKCICVYIYEKLNILNPNVSYFEMRKNVKMCFFFVGFEI